MFVIRIHFCISPLSPSFIVAPTSGIWTFIDDFFEAVQYLTARLVSGVRILFSRLELCSPLNSHQSVKWVVFSSRNWSDKDSAISSVYNYVYVCVSRGPVFVRKNMYARVSTDDHRLQTSEADVNHHRST